MTPICNYTIYAHTFELNMLTYTGNNYYITLNIFEIREKDENISLQQKKIALILMIYIITLNTFCKCKLFFIQSLKKYLYFTKMFKMVTVTASICILKNAPIITLDCIAEKYLDAVNSRIRRLRQPALFLY